VERNQKQRTHQKASTEGGEDQKGKKMRRIEASQTSNQKDTKEGALRKPENDGEALSKTRQE